MDFYRSLQSLLYVIINEETNKYGYEEEISKIYNKNSKKWKLNQDLGEILINSGFILEEYECLYSYIELKSFRSIKEKVPSEYKVDLKSGELKLLDKFISDLENLRDETSITKKYFADALRKFISRYLFISNLKPEHTLVNYILYEDLWDDVFEKENFWDPDCWIRKNFPKNLIISYSVRILEIIDDTDNEQEAKSTSLVKKTSAKDSKRVTSFRRK